MADELIRKKNIYEVDTVLENALIYGVDEWGEVLSEEQISELVEKMEIALTDKLEYMGKLTINADSFANAIDAEIKRLQDKKKYVVNGAERTKNYLDRFIRYKYTDPETGVLDVEGLKKFKLVTPSIKLSYGKSESLDVIDMDKVPSEYIKTVIESKPDKVRLKKYMKDNDLTETDYAKVVTNINLQIK